MTHTCDSSDVADLLVFYVITEQGRLKGGLLSDPVPVVYLYLQEGPVQVFTQLGRVQNA